MKRLLLLWLLVAFAPSCTTKPSVATPVRSSVADAHHAPWSNPRNALVLDVYEKNAIDWDKLAGEPRVAAVIHRASVGFVADAAYIAQRFLARKHGCKWGSYHVGTSDDPVKQADFYLRTVGAARDEVLVLDLEDVSGGKFMNLDQAQVFLRRIHRKIGRYPMIYGGRQIVFAIAQDTERARFFAQMPLWYARYGDAITDFPPGGWRDFTLWQFASETRPGRTPGTAWFPVPGTPPDVDVSVFNGTVDELRWAWPFIVR